MALLESRFVAPSHDFRVGTCGISEAGVWLRGEHDAATVASLSDVLAQAMAQDRSDLEVDLSGVTFMGAATVDVIMRARSFLNQRSRALILVAASNAASRTLALCGLGVLLHPGASGIPLNASTELPVDAA